MLHVHCGDSSADSLRVGGVDGEVVTWADLLHEGPVGEDLHGDAWFDARAAFLSAATGGGPSTDDCRRRLIDQERRLESFVDHDEIVLWFDGCLYDQVILVRQLDAFSRRDLGDRRLSLVCIGDCPSIPDYAGLGQMTPGQLVARLPDRRDVTAAQRSVATAAWAAFRSPDPRGIEALVAGDLSPLPYLRNALVRHLQEFPSARNGLGRQHRQVLSAAAASTRGIHPGPLFRAVSAAERRPYAGDTLVWWFVNQLAEAPEPALELDGPGPLPQWDPPADWNEWTIRVTPFGRTLLAGDADWIETNGVDRHLGGVHLAGHGPAWRYDETAWRLCTPGTAGAPSFL